MHSFQCTFPFHLGILCRRAVIGAVVFDQEWAARCFLWQIDLPKEPSARELRPRLGIALTGGGRHLGGGSPRAQALRGTVRRVSLETDPDGALVILEECDLIARSGLLRIIRS